LLNLARELSCEDSASCLECANFGAIFALVRSGGAA
jgi:hypothetical protein